MIIIAFNFFVKTASVNKIIIDLCIYIAGFGERPHLKGCGSGIHGSYMDTTQSLLQNSPHIWIKNYFRQYRSYIYSHLLVVELIRRSRLSTCRLSRDVRGDGEYCVYI